MTATRTACASAPTSSQADPVAEAAARGGRPGPVLPRRPAGLEGPRSSPTPAAPTALRADAAAAGVDALRARAVPAQRGHRPTTGSGSPRRKLLQQHADAAAEVGAAGLVVHGGHVTADDDDAGRLRQLAQDLRAARGRRCRSSSRTPPAATTPWPAGWTRSARLWDALGRLRRRLLPGHLPRLGRRRSSCPDVVDRVKAITGRVDLVHANDSKDDVRLRPRPARELRHRLDRPGRAASPWSRRPARRSSARRPGGARRAGRRHRLPARAAARADARRPRSRTGRSRPAALG